MGVSTAKLLGGGGGMSVWFPKEIKFTWLLSLSICLSSTGDTKFFHLLWKLLKDHRLHHQLSELYVKLNNAVL